MVALTYDAVILAGGRGSRLGGVDKAALRRDGRTLLDAALSATGGAGAVVVVGPPELPVAAGVTLVRENPPFAGPAAALVAGVRTLGRTGSEWVLVLSCDLVDPEGAVSRLLEGARATDDAEAVVGVDQGGHQQWLTALYRRSALIAAAVELTNPANAPVRSLIGRLDATEVALGESAADVDTVADAERFDVVVPRSTDTPAEPAPAAEPPLKEEQ